MGILIPHIPAWIDDAACQNADPTLFFDPTLHPRRGHRGAPGFDFTEALRICATCPVRLPCLQWAIDAEQDSTLRYGVWGGTTPEQRRTLTPEGHRKL